MLECLFHKPVGLNICNSIKKRLQHSFFPVKLAKFLKTPFFRGVSVAASDIWFAFPKELGVIPEFYYPFKAFKRVIKLCYDGMFFFSLKHTFIAKKYTSSEILSFLHHWVLMKVWIWYRCQNGKENYYHHDGERLGFYKKSTCQNSEQKERCSCNVYIARNEWGPIYLTKTVPKRTSNSIINIEKVDLLEELSLNR